jgi:uncharacterized protein with HEPN domain
LPFEDVRLLLADVLDAILSIERFVHGMDLKKYAEDERTQAAVERKILIISEAAIRLKDAAETICPEYPGETFEGSGIGSGISTIELIPRSFGIPSRTICRLSR